MSIIVNNNVKEWLSDKVGRKINSPEQRLIQGVTALMFQPAFDYYNNSVDNETRAVSVSRTIGKIVAGTTVGVLVRYATIGGARKFSEYTITKNAKDFVKTAFPKSKKDIFMPHLDLEKFELTDKQFKTKYENVVKALGTILGTFTMLFTNFFVDAPCTKYLTKIITPVVRQFINREEEHHGVS